MELEIELEREPSSRLRLETEFEREPSFCLGLMVYYSIGPVVSVFPAPTVQTIRICHMANIFFSKISKVAFLVSLVNFLQMC